MMEGLDQLGQEEFIWAMRTTTLRTSDADGYHESRHSPSQTFLATKSKVVMEAPDEHQTKVMASLVPDEVIYNVDDYSHRQYDACFLFGDVSGFTDLCEKYTKTGVSGPSRMTQVLNKYLGSMVQEVMSHSGDVLKFSGDAFLAIFRTSATETMRDVVHEALDCALVIQKNYGSFLTDVGIVIRVKLAISAGLVTFALIGSETTSHYVVVGKPIWDVKAAESISSAGDIIVAPAAWHYINAYEYLYQEMPDNIHVKITGVGPNWRSVSKNQRQQKDEGDDVLSVDEESMESDVLSQLTQEGDEFSLRPAVNLAVRLKIKENLRRFIIAPVMKSINNDEPFEYLTEMRQAVIVFINVISFSIQTEETVILADRTYKTVCSVVDKMKGCVNKVSLFDKDLMFVVIFGLRGLKHELECQVALRCAKECHTAIERLPGVLCTSIGVTTGKTYCGVFGHTLRREYTVISLIVNKAARLMVAYKGKVTCDRETFLHSKLEAKHFILLPYKFLKGISHPGPVYEFREADIDHSAVQKINACPLLGRAAKLKNYAYLLRQCRDAAAANEEQRYNMFLIKGDARQGKTRLLDELVYLTPEEISINKFTLTQKDHRKPYQTTRLIFNLPLGLNTISSEREKEEKLLNKLKGSRLLHLICALNDVFGVNFEKTNTYLALTEKEKDTALKKLIIQLAYTCFVPFWVLAIDDVDYIDDFSFDIVRYLFDIKTIFFVCTLSRERLIKSRASMRIGEDPRVKINYLKPIERWYLGALACQILDVYALSPELENAIQTKSNGNPGWIESFLITLIQDKALYILKATIKEINDLGLVCPPLYMMARLTPTETFKWQQIMEERKSKEQGVHYDHWQKYIDSCRDSFLNVTVREQMEALSKDGKVPICVISPNFNIADEEMELSMDAMILKTFDSLNFFEQLLVKCSATLGNHFLREMLLYVMSADDRRKAALAVKKLFEIKVLTCAKGDFLEGGNVFPEKLLIPSEETKLGCMCRGLKIEAQCLDLPKYASCGYIQFRSSLFRDITYNLLTDNQKKEFHQRAIKFLERETRKCKACGLGFFVDILGTTHDKELVTVRDKEKGASASGAAWEAASYRTSQYSESLISGSITGMSLASGVPSVTTGAIKKSKSIDEKSLSSFGVSQIYSETKVEKKYRKFGYSVIRKLKNSFSLTREFSTEDFTDCRCNLILCTTYAQLIDHCVGANDLNKLIEAMLGYANLCILLNNIPLAITQLNEVLAILRLKPTDKIENPWKLSLTRARAYAFLGYALIEHGQLNEAHDHLHLALAEYDIKFPKGIARHMMTVAFETKQLLGLYMFPKTLMKTFDHWETIYANNLSECLSHLCTLYMMMGKWKDAEMAACWSLSKALESFSDFRLICTACANMLQIMQQYSRWNSCIALEVYALRLCHLKQHAFQSDDLATIAKLYSVIFIARIHRNAIDAGIHVGYIALRLASSVRACKTILPSLPLLLHVLLNGKHFNNAFSILTEIRYLAEDDTDSSGKVWYYALSMVLEIETGYSVVPYATCEYLHLMEGESWVTIRDVDARKRFFTIMWLWCIRNEKWEAASIWSLKTDDFTLPLEEDSILNKISLLYILEGMLILLAAQRDKLNVGLIPNTERSIKQLFTSIEKFAKSTKLLLPRLYHLKAYYRFIKINDLKVKDLLAKADSYAVKVGNPLEHDFIEHTKKAWNKTLTAAEADFWKEHCDGDLLDFENIELTGTIGFFTLPTPSYQ